MKTSTKKYFLLTLISMGIISMGMGAGVTTGCSGFVDKFADERLFESGPPPDTAPGGGDTYGAQQVESKPVVQCPLSDKPLGVNVGRLPLSDIVGSIKLFSILGNATFQRSVSFLGDEQKKIIEILQPSLAIIDEVSFGISLDLSKKEGPPFKSFVAIVNAIEGGDFHNAISDIIDIYIAELSELSNEEKAAIEEMKKSVLGGKITKLGEGDISIYADKNTIIVGNEIPVIMKVKSGGYYQEMDPAWNSIQPETIKFLSKVALENLPKDIQDKVKEFSASIMPQLSFLNGNLLFGLGATSCCSETIAMINGQEVFKTIFKFDPDFLGSINFVKLFDLIPKGGEEGDQAGDSRSGEGDESGDARSAVPTTGDDRYIDEDPEGGEILSRQPPQLSTE